MNQTRSLGSAGDARSAAALRPLSAQVTAGSWRDGGPESSLARSRAALAPAAATVPVNTDDRDTQL